VRKRASLVVSVVVLVGATIFAGPALAGKPGQGAVREAELTEAEVVPTAGDPGGSGMARFTFYPNKNKICYRIEVSNIDTATEAHLHEGIAGETGAVKLKLKPPGADGSSRECIRGLGEMFIRHISKNPSNYYVDVHYSEFPDGAVRGQLSG